MERKLTFAAAGALLLLFAFAASKAKVGLDYWGDGSSAIDSLARGDLDYFFANQPLMGSFSLLLRAPFAKLVFHESIETVYLMGVLPCFAALAALGLWLNRKLEHEGRSAHERAAIAVVCIATPFTARAVHWGHPEEMLGAALCVAAVLAAGRDRAVLAGLMLGCAIATKQWGVLAGVPALLALSSHGGRRTFVAVTAVVVGALTLPMLIGDPERFMLVTKAAGSASPEVILGLLKEPLHEGVKITPTNLWWPLASPAQTIHGELAFGPELIGRLSHPAIVLAALPLGWALWRRRDGRAGQRDALVLLALLFAIRAVLDPMNLDYYHVPLLASLAAVAAVGTAADVRAMLAAALGLSLAFLPSAASIAAVTADGTAKWVVYMATMLPLTVWLWSALFSYRFPTPLPIRGVACNTTSPTSS